MSIFTICKQPVAIPVTVSPILIIKNLSKVLQSYRIFFQVKTHETYVSTGNTISFLFHFYLMAGISLAFKWLDFQILDPIWNQDHLQINLSSTIQNPDVFGFHIPTVLCSLTEWFFAGHAVWPTCGCMSGRCTTERELTTMSKSLRTNSSRCKPWNWWEWSPLYIPPPLSLSLLLSLWHTHTILSIYAYPWIPVYTGSGWCCSSLKNYV